MIRFENVSKRYSTKSHALSDVTLEIPDGEFVFLIGQSGAGKTTILRLILRDIIPTEGKIFVNDLQVNKMPKGKIHLLRRSVGMVFQDFKLLQDRTIYENVAIALEILGKNQEETKKNVADVLELVGISSKRNLFPIQLSAGELQRASIARAIVAGPKFLLADEPTGNLDPTTSWDIMRILSQINSLGTTVIIATHNASIVNEMKKRTITIEQGKVIRDEMKGKYHLTESEKTEENHKTKKRGDGHE